MTVEISDIIDAAKIIFESVDGIKKVLTEAVDTPPSGDLPCVIPVIRGFDSGNFTNGVLTLNYEIKWLLLVSPYSASLPSIEKKAQPLGPAVARAFHRHVHLGNYDIFDGRIPRADYGRIEYNSGAEYVGWTFTMRVKTDETLEVGA